MALEFARRLRDIVATAHCESGASLDFGLGMVADVLMDTFDSNFLTTDVDRHRATESAEIARAAAEIVDACHLIEAHLLAVHPETCFLEFCLPQDRGRDSLVKFFEEAVHRVASNTAFVCVVWNLRSERCLHVAGGYKDDARGLALSTRGELLSALQEGSLLAVMLPSPTSTSIAFELEAALLKVFARRKLLPAVDGKLMPIPAARGAARLAEISQLLHEVASGLSATTASL